MAGWRGLAVLVVSPTPTAPVDFGNRRYIHNTCRSLQEQGARIIFVHYPAEHDWRDQVPLDQLAAMQAQWEVVYVAPVTGPLHPDPVGDHHTVDEWWDEGLGGLLRWIFATHRIDVCIVHYTWLSRALTLCPPGVLKVLATHDRFTGRKEMLRDNGLAPEFFYLTADSERTALMRADLVWAIKDEERRHFEATADRPVRVLPHFERADLAFSCRVPREDLPRFGFFAARNRINEANYRRFFDMLDIMVRHWLLPARFVLAGSLCALFDSSEFPFLERLGQVPASADFYRAVDVVVVPMAFSTGLKIKVGEALGHGKALIAHAHAFDGYRPCHRFHALDSYEAMGRAILAVVDTPALIDEMELAAARAARDAATRAEDCLRATLAGADRRRRLVVLVPAALLAAPLVVDHVSDLCRTLRPIAWPEIHVTGSAATVPDRVWRRLARHARLSAAPFADMATQDALTAAEVSFVDPAPFRAQGCVVLYSLACDDAFAAWRGHAGEMLLRLEHWDAPQDRFDDDVAALRPLLDQDPGAIVLLGSEAAEASLRRRGITARLVRVPLLQDEAGCDRLRRLRDRPRAGVCLLAGEADEPVLRRLVAQEAFRARWARQPCGVMAPEPLLARLRGDAAFAGFGLGTPESLPMVPELFVDLGQEPGAHAWLRELCARAALPYLAGTGLRGLAGLMSAEALAAERVQWERGAAFLGDSGWAWVWRRVKEAVLFL